MASNNNNENRDDENIPYAERSRKPEPESSYLENEIFGIEATNDINHNNNLEIAEEVLNSDPNITNLLMASNNNNENRDDENIPYAEPESSYLVNEIFRIEATNDINHNNNLEIAEEVLNSAPNITNTEFNSIWVSNKLNEIIRNVEEELNTLVDNFGKNTSFDDLEAVANSIFEEGASVKKIIILIAFGYKWLTKYYKTVVNAFETVMEFLYKVLAGKLVKSFVIQSGGWIAILFQ